MKARFWCCVSTPSVHRTFFVYSVCALIVNFLGSKISSLTEKKVWSGVFIASAQRELRL